jgi:poly-gamma-glutamate synthesis protein (capsule biosynthesis protein)
VLTSYYHADWDPYGRLEPGSRPQIATAPLAEDLEALSDGIRRARADADLVLVSCHWGDSSRPAFLHDYEKAYGRAAIESGADAVLGHHHHFLRGAELYRQKPIFYGLGHFAFDLPGLEAVLTPEGLRRLHAMGEYAIYPRAGWPLLPFHPDARMSVIAFCTFRADSTVDAYLLPCMINQDNQPVPCDAESEAGLIVADYLRRITLEAGLATSYEPTPLPVGDFAGLRLGHSATSSESPP